MIPGTTAIAAPLDFLFRIMTVTWAFTLHVVLLAKSIQTVLGKQHVVLQIANSIQTVLGK
jgi:hypothetical protein